MNIQKTTIPDVFVIEPKIYSDERGYFMEAYQETRFREAGIKADFIQDNQSGSGQGVVRGIHYQLKHAQGKLLRVVKGAVYDVAVDLRRSSPTFGQFVGEILSDGNFKQMWVPPGFGHGFYVLSEWAEFIYKVTDVYSPEWERTILWNDPDLAIEWPLLEGVDVRISDKDAAGVPFQLAEVYE